MNVLRIQLVSFLVIFIVFSSSVRAQEIVGFNLVDRVIEDDLGSRFVNHIGYRRLGFPFDKGQVMLKYGYEGFEYGRWRYGISFGLGNVIESVSVDVRVIGRMHKMLDVFAEVGVGHIDDHGFMPSFNTGIVLYDDVEISGGLVWDNNAKTIATQAGFGINIHSAKKSLIVHGVVISVGIPVALVMLHGIGNSR